MGNIYLSIQKGWFDKNKEAAAKLYAERSDEENDKGFLFDLDNTKESLEVDGGQITWSFTGEDRQNDDPYLSVTYDLDDEDWIKLAEMVIKRLNKVKAAIEAVQD